MPGGAAAWWVLGVSPLSIPTQAPELSGTVAGFKPARRQWLHYTAPGCAREGATPRQHLPTHLMSFHTKTRCAFLLTVMKTLTQRLCCGAGGHVLLPEHLQDIKQLLSPEQRPGWEGEELSKIILAQYEYMLLLEADSLLLVSLCLPWRNK